MKHIKYDRIVIFDMELTCWDTPVPQGQEKEIISIGICEVDTQTQEILRGEHFFIRPRNSEISDFCSKLTGIHTRDVIKAPYLEDVCRRISKKYSSNRPWGAWGRDDLMLQNACIKAGCESPCSIEYVNIGALWTMLTGNTKSVGLKSAMTTLGLEFQGKQHNALDDAINTARVYNEVSDSIRLRFGCADDKGFTP